MHHKINASLRNKANREIAHRTPLCAVDADSAKHAIELARGRLLDAITATPLCDSVVLHIYDAKGGMVTATEFAEDYLRGKGSSLAQSTLMDKNADHGLTPEERDAALERLQTAAVDAMPVARDAVVEQAKTDAVDDFFAGMPAKHRKPKPSDAGNIAGHHDRPIATGGVLKDGKVSKTWDDVTKAFDIVLTPDQKELLQSQIGKSLRQMGKSNLTAGKILNSGAAAPMLDHLRDGFNTTERATGKRPESVALGKTARKQLANELGMHERDLDGMQLHGVTIVSNVIDTIQIQNAQRKSLAWASQVIIMDEASYIDDYTMKNLLKAFDSCSRKI